MLGGRYLLAFLAMASFSVTSADLNMNNICALVNDGLKIASYDACNVFYTCIGGIAFMQSCTTGLYFDKDYQACMTRGQVNCLTPNRIPCYGYDVGSWAPVSGSCSGYYYCGADAAQQSSCPNGENFNPKTQSCVFANLYPCIESTVSDSNSNESNDTIDVPINIPINLCNLIPDDIYFGSPSTCGGWTKCENNVATTGFCPTGYLYNVLKMECDFPADVTCSQVTNDPYLTANTCSVQYETISSSNCSSYYICDGSYYQLVQCPNGLFYDTVSKTCVNRENARNNCNRCTGVMNGYVNMYSTQSCTGYLSCFRGKEIGNGYCSSGRYFDERLGGCINTTTEPLLGCCNPAYYNS